MVKRLCESVYNIFQSRVKGSDGSSLVEKDKEAAVSGLSKDYYEKLKNKSVAEVNLETLSAIDKLAYFVYKLHQDNERIALIMSVSGMRLTGEDVGYSRDFINPIGKLIEYKCWNDSKDERTNKICRDPKGGTAMQPTL